MEAARGRRPPRQARPARLRAVEGPQGVRAGDGVLALALGTRPAGLAHRVLGDGGEVPRQRLRHPRRRRRPALPAPRERAGPVARGRAPVRVVLDAQRVDHHLRREDEQVARQLAAGARTCSSGCAASSCATTWSRRTTARRWSSASRRSRRRRRRSGGSRASCERVRAHRARRDGAARRPSTHAMDDDLGTPAAVGGDPRRRARGQQALADGRDPTAPRRQRAEVRAMLGVLGLDPADPHWATGDGSDDLHAGRRRAGAGAARAARGGPGRQGLRGGRRDPRPDQGRRHRDRGHPRRTEVERAGCQVIRSARARSRRPARATRPPAPAAGSAWARGQGADAEGQGPAVPQGPQEGSARRRQHRAAARVARSGKGGGDHEWIAGRNSVVEALRAALPVTSVYVAEGAERDGRLREVFAIAADKGISLLEVPRVELDRMTAGCGAPGTRRARAGVRVRRPDGLPRRRGRQRGEAADRRARLGDRPAQPRRRRTLRRGLRRPRCGDPRATRGRA